MGLVDADLLELVLVDGVVAEGAAFPRARGVFVVRQVLQDAGVAKDVPTFCDSRR